MDLDLTAAVLIDFRRAVLEAQRNWASSWPPARPVLKAFTELAPADQARLLGCLALRLHTVERGSTIGLAHDGPPEDPAGHLRRSRLALQAWQGSSSERSLIEAAEHLCKERLRLAAHRP